MSEKLNQLITVKELSGITNLAESYIYSLINKKKLPCIKLGGKVLFDINDEVVNSLKQSNDMSDFVKNECVNVKDLSNWIKLSISHIYFLANNDLIPYLKIRGRLAFEKEKIKDWIKQQNNKSISIKENKNAQISTENLEENQSSNNEELVISPLD
jgi:excisionase family DNA binding protein